MLLIKLILVVNCMIYQLSEWPIAQIDTRSNDVHVSNIEHGIDCYVHDLKNVSILEAYLTFFGKKCCFIPDKLNLFLLGAIT